MTTLESYLLLSNALLLGLFVWSLFSGLKLHAQYNALRRYAGFVTEFAVKYSKRSEDETLEAFNKFIDAKFEEMKHVDN